MRERPFLTKEDLLECAERFGTPVYVYDTTVIKQKLATLRASFDTDRLDIHYAAKALTNQNILRFMAQHGCGIDSVSIEEMQIAMHAGIPADRINFTPSGSALEEYLFALEHGIRLHVDNLGMLARVASHRPGCEIVLRFNPDIKAGGHAYLEVGANESKFGFFPEELACIKELVTTHGLKIVGVHVHVGSDIADESYFLSAFEYLETVATHFLEDLQLIDFGGGFKVRYHQADNPTDVRWLAGQIIQRFESFCRTVGKPLRLVLEPGKYLVSEAGYLLARITAMKLTEHKDIAYLNTGFNHLLRPMYYGAYHKISNLSNPDAQSKQYKIAGYLCETDTFALGRPVSEIRTGDVLCFHNAGAYAFSMASNYNSRVRPPEVMWMDGTLHLIRKKESVVDLLKNELDIQIQK